MNVKMEQEKINTNISKKKFQVKCSQCKIIESVDMDLYFQQRESYLCDKCQKEITLKRQEELIKQKLPQKYLSTNFRDKELVDKCFKKSIFVTGKSGVGKTVFIADLLKKYIYNNLDVLWLSYPKFIMQVQSLFRKQTEDPFELVKEIAGFIGVLFIDDLGVEKITDYVKQITYFLINEREQNELLTCITSNYSLQQIDELIDSRISSRIAGMCKSIKFSGEDKRLKT